MRQVLFTFQYFNQKHNISLTLTKVPLQPIGYLTQDVDVDIGLWY